MIVVVVVLDLDIHDLAVAAEPRQRCSRRRMRVHAVEMLGNGDVAPRPRVGEQPADASKRVTQLMAYSNWKARLKS